MENQNGMNLLETLGGGCQLLLSAPHAHDHRRPSLSASIKQAEPWTDHIVRVASSDLDAFAMMQQGECPYDPNYHREEDNAYKRKMREFVKENKLKYFVDVHGLSDIHNYDVAIYYPIRYGRSRRLADGVAKALDQKELVDLTVHIYNFSPGLQETLTEFAVYELGITGIQIEVARYIREDSDLRASLINNLESYLSVLEF